MRTAALSAGERADQKVAHWADKMAVLRVDQTASKKVAQKAE